MFDKILKIIDTTLHTGKFTIGNLNDAINLANRCNLSKSELDDLLNQLYSLTFTDGDTLSYRLTTDNDPDAFFTYSKDNFNIIFNKVTED